MTDVSYPSEGQTVRSIPESETVSFLKLLTRTLVHVLKLLYVTFQYLSADGTNLSLAERRTRRNDRLLPVRFRQPPPQPLAPVTIISLTDTEVEEGAALPQLGLNNISSAAPDKAQALEVLCTNRNIFGLFRQYHSAKLPEHEPEAFVDILGLSDSSITDTALLETSYHPYPNQNSFLLGDWYWAGGQKSQRSFQDLLTL